MVVGFFHQCFKGRIFEIRPFGTHPRFIGFKTMFPIGQKTRRDDGCIMSPVFEQIALLFKQMAQMFALVGLIAGKQDLMMCALNRANAVDLHEAQFLDELQQAIPPKRGIRRGTQALTVEENQSCICIRNQSAHGAICSDKFEHIKNSPK